MSNISNIKSFEVQASNQTVIDGTKPELVNRARHYYDFPEILKRKGQLNPVCYPDTTGEIVNVYLVIDFEMDQYIYDELNIKVDVNKYDDLCAFAMNRWMPDVKYQIVTRFYGADHKGERNDSVENEKLFKKVERFQYNGLEVYNSRSQATNFCWLATRITNIGAFAKYNGGKHVVILLGNDSPYADALHDSIIINKGNFYGYVFHGHDFDEYLVNPSHLKNNSEYYDYLHSMKMDVKLARMLQMDFPDKRRDDRERRE